MVSNSSVIHRFAFRDPWFPIGNLSVPFIPIQSSSVLLTSRGPSMILGYGETGRFRGSDSAHSPEHAPGRLQATMTALGDYGAGRCESRLAKIAERSHRSPSPKRRSWQLQRHWVHRTLSSRTKRRSEALIAPSPVGTPSRGSPLSPTTVLSQEILNRLPG
jgi:hypothetical protein